MATAEELRSFRPIRFAEIEERLLKDGTFLHAGGHNTDEDLRVLPWERPQGHAHEFDRLAGYWIEQGGPDADMVKDHSGSEALLGSETEYEGFGS